jgi:hypothetical protein
MFAMESNAAVRRFVFLEGRSRREAARGFGLTGRAVAADVTVNNIAAHKIRTICLSPSIAGSGYVARVHGVC